MVVVGDTAAVVDIPAIDSPLQFWVKIQGL